MHLTRFARYAVPAALVATLVAAPATAAGHYAEASDGFPSGAPAEAVWQPTILAEDLPEFVRTYGAANVEILRIDGIVQMAPDWQSVGMPIKSARDIGRDKTEFVARGASGRSIGVRVADDVELTINVHRAGGR